ncbi:hypothetical protein DWB61_02925 [Ancylomarina euxinus]|uniref:Uncharacterized protein n=1 Tax=Ancylomarina euxinus TaxID=2283627 RepID=A0A425Y6K8_9BACT|nr:hypothetical protein DWB61_02925 [Ancylomarina euxinus]
MLKDLYVLNIVFVSQLKLGMNEVIIRPLKSCLLSSTKVILFFFLKRIKMSFIKNGMKDG